MPNEIILSGLSAKDLVELLRPMIAQEVKQIKDNEPERLLSPAETCKLFQPKISLVTLKVWSQQGRLKDYKIGGRVYYKQSEILESLTTIKKYQKV